MILPKSTARATSCSSGSIPLAFRKGRLPLLRLNASHIPAAKYSSLPKRAAFSETTRPYNTSFASLTPVCTRNTDEKSVTSISPCGDASEKISCLSSLTKSSLKPRPREPASWTLATHFSRKVTLTTSYGASDTGLTVFLIVIRPCWRGLTLLGEALKTVRRIFRDRVPTPTRPNHGSLRASCPLVEIASSESTLRRDSTCA